VAPTDAWVLLIGEPGTGKSLTARSIHKMSERAEAPFVEIDCASVPEDELTSDLFGHEPRAFKSKKLGLFEIVDGGTIFFKNILKLPASLQIKLLQVVETRSFYRLRGTRRVSTDFRMIASTCGANHEMAHAVARGEFRADLLYRINTVQIGLAALRERGDCIEPLVRHLLERICGPDGMEIKEEALAALKVYEWPGNVRQLLNCLERAVLSASENVITVCDLLPEVTAQPAANVVEPKSVTTEAGMREAGMHEAETGAIHSALPEVLSATPNIAPVPLREVERRQILRALRLTGWHREKTAQILGISLSTLYRRLRDYSLEYRKGVSRSG
ncbi:MAG: sigma 54-interacting transcriptional regulator, partial [Pyrinomonadaceae bacterium]